MERYENPDSNRGTPGQTSQYAAFQQDRRRAQTRHDTSPANPDNELVIVPQTSLPAELEYLEPTTHGTTPVAIHGDVTPRTDTSGMNGSKDSESGVSESESEDSGDSNVEDHIRNAANTTLLAYGVQRAERRETMIKSILRNLVNAYEDLGQPPAEEYKAVANEVAKNMGQRYRDKKDRRKTATVSTISTHESEYPMVIDFRDTHRLSENTQPEIRVTHERAQTSGSTANPNYSRGEIVAPSNAKVASTDSTSLAGETRPPYRKPVPQGWDGNQKWLERVKTQKQRQRELNTFGRSDIPDQGVDVTILHPRDMWTLPALPPEELTGQNGRNDLTPIPEERETRVHWTTTLPNTPLSVNRYQGRPDTSSDPLVRGTSAQNEEHVHRDVPPHMSNDARITNIPFTNRETRHGGHNIRTRHGFQHDDDRAQDRRRHRSSGPDEGQGDNWAEESRESVFPARRSDARWASTEPRYMRGFSMPPASYPHTTPVGVRGTSQHYREVMVERLMETIRSALDHQLTFPEGYKPFIKGEGGPKYDGSQKFGDLEDWLTRLAHRYSLMRFGGDNWNTDRVRVISMTDYLEGDALKWFTTHVLSPKRTTVNWSFSDVIIGLYDRYILPTSMQDARESFRKVRFTASLGVQGYYDTLLEHAQNMAVFPDEYTMLEEFIYGLPNNMVERCFREHRLTVESNTIDDWVSAAKDIEVCEKTEAYYKGRSKSRNSTPATTKASPKGNSPNGAAPRWNERKAPTRGPPKRTGGEQMPFRGKGPRYQPAAANGQAEIKTGDTKPGRPPETPRTGAAAGKKCFICGVEGHFASTHQQRGKTYVRAAHTHVGDGDDGDDEEEEESGSVRAEARTDSEVERLTSQQEEHDHENNVIEIPAEDFFGEVDADPEFIASMYAFPLQETRGVANANQAHEGQPETNGAIGDASAAPAQANGKKYRIRHSGKTRLRPKVPPEEKECLATWVTVGNLRAWTLWDSGSTTTGITPAFAEIAKISVDTLEDPHVLQLGTVGSRSIIKYGADTEIQVANTSINSYVDIANFDRYDMIIGTPWMRRNKVVLDFDTDQVLVNGVSIPAIKIKVKDLDPRLHRHRVTDKKKVE